MKAKILIIILILSIILIGCEKNDLEIEISNEDNLSEIRKGIVDEETTIVKKEQQYKNIVGPGGCMGEQCNTYFNENPEESMKWCDENPTACNLLNQGQNFEGPNGCTDDCEQFCDSNVQECQKWCEFNAEKNPELCEFMIMGEERGARQGDGVWEKEELTFYIKDSENILTTQKRKVIIGTINSQEKIGKAYLGWNSALEQLNKLYPENVVPDRIVEIAVEEDADLIIEVHSEKEYCCDLAGLPVKGIERSTIDDNNTKIKSDVDVYNIINIDLGFLEDMTMHEIGHSLGLFGHVTERNNDLMSIISPGRGIKEGNLNDLYIKYRDKKIETVDETRERDQSVRDSIVSPPD